MSFVRNTLRVGIATAAPVAAACSVPTGRDSGIVCTLEARAGINLSIVDSLSGAPLSGAGAIRLQATDGAYADSLRSATRVGTWATAWERAGSYAVTIDADGYRLWRKDGVFVGRDACHVIPVTLVARLVKP